jgi:hypothetical protein
VIGLVFPFVDISKHGPARHSYMIFHTSWQSGLSGDEAMVSFFRPSTSPQ